MEHILLSNMYFIYWRYLLPEIRVSNSLTILIIVKWFFVNYSTFIIKPFYELLSCLPFLLEMRQPESHLLLVWSWLEIEAKTVKELTCVS